MSIVCTCPCPKGGEKLQVQAKAPLLLRIFCLDEELFWKPDVTHIDGTGFTPQTPYPLKSVFPGSKRQQNLQRFKTHSREPNIRQSLGTPAPQVSIYKKLSKTGAARQHRTGFEYVTHILLGCSGMYSAEGGFSGLSNRFTGNGARHLISL